MKRRKLLPFVDLSAFFLFFGVSGLDGDRKARLNERFEKEYFSFMVTAQLSAKLAGGLYRLEGLPDDLNRRGWAVRNQGEAQASVDLSEEGWRDLQSWLKSAARTVQPVRIGDLPQP